MKSSSRFFIFTAALFCLATVHAANPREELTPLTAQLQSNPSDTALREKIIKLAQTIKPAPAVPEEAQRRLGRGQAAFETAKEPADFDKAIAEFQAASNAAPWLAAPYYNLGVAQEKSKKYREATVSFKLYLLAAPSATDAGAVKQKLYKLEYLAEQPPSDDELLKKVNGARFIRTDVNVWGDSRGDIGFEINGKVLFLIRIARVLGPDDRRYNPHLLNNLGRESLDFVVYKGSLKWEEPRERQCSGVFATWQSCQATTYEISPDGQTLTYRSFYYGDRQMGTEIYPRAN